MNDAHLHLVVNHFPIIGTILALAILVTGTLLKNNSVKNTAYVLFIVAAIFAAFSMGTGEGAEELVEDMPTIGHGIIHEHEESAEKFALILYAIAAASAFGFYLNIKKKTKANLVSVIIIVLGVVAVFLAQQTGISGGEIRHTEIREGVMNNPVDQTIKKGDSDEKTKNKNEED